MSTPVSTTIPTTPKTEAPRPTSDTPAPKKAKKAVLKAPELGEHAGTMPTLDTMMPPATPSESTAETPKVDKPKKPRAPAKKKADEPAEGEPPKTKAKKSSKKEEKEPLVPPTPVEAEVKAEEEKAEEKKKEKKTPVKKEKKDALPFTDFLDPLANKDMLAALCRKYGLKVTGKVAELRARLEEYRAEHPAPQTGDQDMSEAGPSNREEKKSATPLNILSGLGGKTNTKKEKKGAMPPVLKKLKANAQRHVVARNRFGNYEHAETRLIFDPDDRMVVGRQDYASGNVLELTDEDIEVCKQYKFNYRLPENLDSNKKGLKDIKVGEADDELNEEDLEEGFEEELEDDDEGAEEDPFGDDE